MAKSKVVLLMDDQLVAVDANEPFTPKYDGWYVENKALKRLFQELKIEK